MGVDGTTTLGGADTGGSDLADPGWGPGQFQAYQLHDYLDFRAVYTGVENRSILRLWSNLEAHFYGELILHDGAIRSTDTMAIHCVADATDIVSFRTGSNVGTQVAKILDVGTFQIYDGGLSMALSATTLRFYDDATFQAATPGAVVRKITFDAGDLWFRTSGTLWSKLSTGELRFYDSFTILAESVGGIYKTATIQAKDIVLTNMSTGSFSVNDNSGNRTLLLEQDANLTVSAPNSESAKLTLDSTTPGGDAWEVFSAYTDSELKIANGSGIVVRVTSGGSVYSSEYLGTTVKSTSGSPASGAGEPGAMIVDNGGGRLWVKVGASSWKWAALN